MISTHGTRKPPSQQANNPIWVCENCHGDADSPLLLYVNRHQARQRATDPEAAWHVLHETCAPLDADQHAELTTVDTADIDTLDKLTRWTSRHLMRAPWFKGTNWSGLLIAATRREVAK